MDNHITTPRQMASYNEAPALATLNESISNYDMTSNSVSGESRNENIKIRKIQITEVNRGYIVEVGCHTFAISTPQELTEKLVDYINNPTIVEKKWFEGKLF